MSTERVAIRRCKCCARDFALRGFVLPPEVFTHSFPVVGSLELGGVQLLHLEHRLHCPLRAGRRGILEQVGQETRHHLPGHAELVLEPAALLGVRVAARRELLLAIVDLVLRLAADDQ